MAFANKKTEAVNHAGAPLAGVFAERQVERGFEPLELTFGKLPNDFPDGAVFYSAQTKHLRDDGTVMATIFCGDGGITGIRFEKGQVSGAYKFIMSDDFKREEKKGIRMARFGTPGSSRFSGRLGGLANQSNTNILWWRDRLYGLCEGGLPVEINPDTLESVGDTDFEGVIKGVFSAHYHTHKNGDIYNFGLRHYPLIGTMIDIYCLNKSGKITKVTSFRLPWAHMMHDFGLSENHAVFYVAPVHFNIGKVVKGYTLDESLEFGKKGAELIVVPLKNPKGLFRVDLPEEKGLVWHPGNAYEEDGKIVLDYFHYDDPKQSFIWVRNVITARVPRLDPSKIIRVMVDTKNKTAEQKVLLDVAAAEFPVVAESVRCVRHRYLYAITYSDYDKGEGSALWDQVAKFDLKDEKNVTRQTLMFDGAHPSEPLFVPKKNAKSEDDAYLVTRLYYPPKKTGELSRGEIAVIDAKKLKVVTRYALKEKMTTMIFHGVWVGEGYETR